MPPLDIFLGEFALPPVRWSYMIHLQFPSSFLLPPRALLGFAFFKRRENECERDKIEAKSDRSNFIPNKISPVSPRLKINAA